MNIKILKATLAGLVLSVSTFANAGLISFNTVDNGWYDSNGTHNITNNNTWTGCTSSNFCRNSFYNFELGSILNDTTITSAYIKFFSNGQYVTTDNSELVELWDVTTSPGQGSSLAVYNDLMSGTLYGSNTIFGTSQNNMPEFNISLNTSSYTDLLQGGAFSVGAHLANIPNNQYQVIWSSSNLLPAAELFIEYETKDVPEPSTLAIFALGIMGLASRRFKKQS